MITRIVLSDLHAGAKSSLLSHVDPGGHPAECDPRDPSSMTTAFATALGAFLAEAGSRPQLCLLGDQLDLQFSPRTRAFASAEGFLRALSGTGCLQPRILATAGNHDHALWTEARLGFERQTLETGQGDPVYLDATGATEQGGPAVAAPLLSALARRAGFDGADMRYPNIAFGAGQRAVILHHGHFCEAPYRAVSTMLDALGTARPPLDAGRLAAENAGWIDFLWATFGDAREMGEDAEDLYQRLLTSAGFRTLSDRWSRIAGDALGERLPRAGDRDLRSMLRAGLRVAMDATLGRFRDTARDGETTALAAAERLEIARYLTDICLPQLADETGATRPPGDVTFVLGHTHKPFASRVALPGRAPVTVCNTGGWPLNGPRLDNAEGAAMLLMDDALNVALLRLFKTPDNGVVPLAHIEMPHTDDAGARRFRDRIARCFAATRSAWQEVADVAGREYLARQRMLLRLTGRSSDAGRGMAAE
ncbi:hypothetical protein [Litorisediminicola beolgyonensis]|uniref:Calcineurin-like phosphoesterase domain-containing protein n=1 Tax=Litorisediminicola beolgyonensis TaxID=1173614 RepID=A0ABW3ZJC1_9RHOB